MSPKVTEIMKHPNPLRPYKAQLMLGLIAVLLAMAGSCFGQEMSCKDKQATVIQVIEMPGKSSTEIYRAAMKWAAVNLAAPKSSIENELIAGNAFTARCIQMGFAVNVDFTYSYTIDIKEGKMRVTLAQMTTGDYKIETYCCKNDGSIRSNSQSTSIKESVVEFLSSRTAKFNFAKDDW